MSKDLDARLRRLEQQNTTGNFDLDHLPRPAMPLASMSKEWQDQYHKDPKILEDIWHDTVRDYHQKHIDEWRQHPERYADDNGNISQGLPPWLRLVPHDSGVWRDMVKDASTRFTVWRILKHEDTAQ